MKIEDLRAEVDRLKKLLDDPQEGLFTWHGAVSETWKRIAEGFGNPHWWNHGEEAYHPEWGRVIVIDSNRDGMGHMRARQMDTDAQCVVPVSPECLTKDPPKCRGCLSGHLERRASDCLFACNNCGATASQVRDREAAATGATR